MKSKVGFVWAMFAAFGLGQAANAQVYQPMPGGVYNQGGPVGMYDQGGFQPMMGDFQVGMPGRVWVESNVADRGLGYQGSYLTLGGKTRLFEDRFDGRWLLEGQAHYALESSGFFGNLGIERAYSIKAAGADFVVGGWADVDDDRQGDFAHTFYQLGINAAIKTRRWDVVGNGYFPVATQNYTLGDPTGVNCFLNNNIVLIPGIDSALSGFDVTLRTRPSQLAMVNGTVDIGGYGYQSDLIDSFHGGRVRLGAQVLRGLIVNAEVNHDERFDTTGVLQFAWIFGANARGTEYSPLGRDLDPTMRNDHIVRFQQDLVLAIDPDTGAPYNVLHVDNTADPAFSNGMVQTPFRSLADAELASVNDDIIFVREGDGTTNFYNTGITLKDGQMLLGDGVEHLIPIQDGRFFRLCNDLDGLRPRITDNANGPAVQLADRNTVRGFIMDGSNGTMGYGVFGNGALLGAPVNGGVIEDNDISGAILHGVYVDDSIGNWTFARNNISNNGFDGIFMENACDPTSIFRYEDNIVSDNGRHGIHMRNWDAATLTLLRNTTNGNGGDGVRLDTFKAGAGQRANVLFQDHVADANLGNGINVINGDGNLRFLNSLITNNLGSGIRLEDWTNNNALDQTLVDVVDGGTSTISGNGIGAGAGIDVILNGGTQRLEITNSTVDSNGIGIRAVANNIGAVLNTSVLDNLSVSNNFGDGMQFNVLGGALHNVVIDNPTSVVPGSLPMLNNGAVAGDGIRFLVGDGGVLASTMNARVQRTTISGSNGNGISARVIGAGNLQLQALASTVSGNAGDGVSLDIDNTAVGAVNTIGISSLLVQNNAGNGINLVTGNNTLTDLAITSTVITNTASGGNNGVRIRTAGDGADVAVDNRTRVSMRGSIISNFANDGLSAIASGDSHLLMYLDSNQVFNNGDLGDPDALPYANGIDITASNTSVVNLAMTNNLVTNNFERGLFLGTTGTGTLNAVLVGNNLADNDAGEDIGNDPIQDSNLIDIEFTNGVNGTMCVALSSNFFQFDTLFQNLAAANDFVVELDGLTNGITMADVGGNFNPQPFGSVCQGLLDAEDLAFQASGFPPL